MLVNATHSASYLAHQLRDYLLDNEKSTKEDQAVFVRETLLEKGFGVYDVTDEEVDRLLDDSDPLPASHIFSDIISRRAQVGWSTHGHSGSFSVPRRLSETN